MKLIYKLEGPPQNPVLIFSNSLGAEMMMWDDLIPFLVPHFRILRYNTNPLLISKEKVSIEDLANQVIELMNLLQIEQAYFCGLSMGGLIGQSLAIHHPDRITKVVLSNTASKIGNEDIWNERINIVQKEGLSILGDIMMERWFTSNFSIQYPSKVDDIRNVFLNSNPQLYLGNCAAIRDANFTDALSLITIPTLVITGDEDPVTTVIHAYELSTNIPHAQMQVLPTKHLSSTELPLEYSNLLINFLLPK